MRSERSDGPSPCDEERKDSKQWMGKPVRHVRETEPYRDAGTEEEREPLRVVHSFSSLRRIFFLTYSTV